jgi:alpha-tubulin suppressor-like RCC1 family protein
VKYIPFFRDKTRGDKDKLWLECFVWCLFVTCALWAPSYCAPSGAKSRAVSRVVFNSNLIVNSGADAAAGSTSSGGSVVPVPGWTRTGSFTAVQYGSGAFPSATSPGPPDRGRNFFAGGPGSTVSTGAQDIDVSSSAADIDAGRVMFNLSGYLGGFSSQNDNATLRASFLSAAGATLSSSVLGPVTAAQRGNVTGLLLRSATGSVPIGTRTVRLVLTMTRLEGTANDGYADSLSLVLAPSITVTNTNDIGAGSLRNAITLANATPGTLIRFNIPRASLAADGTATIRPATALPSITADGTVIDGDSQSTLAADTNPSGPEIVLNGSALPAGTFVPGLLINASNCAVRGLTVNGFAEDAGIRIGTFGSPGKNNNRIESCYIGTNFNAAAAVPNNNGIVISAGARNNTVGGVASTSTRNIISGNTEFGVLIEESGSNANVVAGNYIGTNRVGTSALPNVRIGVYITGGAQNNLVGSGGGTNPAARNVISSNINYGVLIEGTGTNGNRVEGNIIGPNAAGTALLLNANSKPDVAGVEIAGGARNNVIGGTNASQRNIISGNGVYGVQIRQALSSNNFVQGNYLGVDISGTQALGNGSTGVTLAAPGNFVGGTVAGASNVVSGNGSIGVLLIGTDASGNVVTGNLLGTNASGNAALANRAHGVAIFNGAQNNRIGGTTAAERNVLSGNGLNGVAIGGSTGSGPLGGLNTRNNRVQGNYIGTNVNGTGSVPNGSPGIAIATSARNNIIGGAGAGNVISGNNSTGIAIFENGTINNVVQGNLIGVAAGGSAPLPNRGNGIAITNGAGNNLIGATSLESSATNLAALGNRIAFNAGNGVLITSGTGSTLRGNRIYNNGALGINLQPAGEAANTVTVNDARDGDAGPNNLQNFPTVNSVSLAGSNLTISGGINSVPNTSLVVDVYRSSARDTSGFGEGEMYVGSRTVRTDGSGNFAGPITLPFNGSLSGQFISVIATNLATGDSSEFSRAVEPDASSGPVGAWGYNEYGQLGDGTTIFRPQVVSVTLPDAVAIAAGGAHSLAVRNDGTVVAWGLNRNGQLGDGTRNQRPSAVAVIDADGVGPLSNVVQVAAGWYHSLALKSDGTVWAWGKNENGQLGDGSRTQRLLPVQVSGLRNVQLIAAGVDFSAAVVSDGTVWTWGKNDDGQLGIGNRESQALPLRVLDSDGNGLRNISAISLGGDHAIALTTSGVALTWGANASGQLGNGSRDDALTAQPIRNVSFGGSTITAPLWQLVAAGYGHSLLLTRDGRVFSGGNNFLGQLGQGNNNNQSTLRPVVAPNSPNPVLSNIVAIRAGAGHSVALGSDGLLRAWGWNQFGNLGDGTRENRNLPVIVRNLRAVTLFDAGYAHTLAIGTRSTTTP